MTSTKPDMRRLQVNPARAAEARAWLAAVDAARPDLTRAPPRPNHRRGIDVYQPETLRLGVIAIALEQFRLRHGRLPDPANPPRAADHFFLEKFFGFFPKPNPADKLNAALYVPEALAGDVRIPHRPWIGEAPVLPPDDAVPPGAYYLKLALGNATNRRVRWPLAPADRAALEETARQWFATRYGVIWGEWWYGLDLQRLFLEEDLTDRRAGRPEWKVRVRDGRPVLIGAVVHRPPEAGGNLQAYYDGTFRLLEGRSEGYGPLALDPPASAERILRVAAGIGRRFELIRVDFLDTGEDRPWLNEVTIGDVNARRKFEPDALEQYAKRVMFG